MIFDWIKKKPYIFELKHIKYKTLRISRLIKNKEHLYKVLMGLLEFPNLNDGNWIFEHNFKDKELGLDGIIMIHNLNPLNETIDEDKINLLIEKEAFVIEDSKYMFVNEYLKSKSNVKTFEEYYDLYKENKIKDLINEDFLNDEDKQNQELENKISKMVNSDEILDSFIDKCNITGHALFLYIPDKNDIDLFEFHNFEDLYKYMKIIYENENPKNYRYSISEELLTLEEYIKFLNIFGKFENIEKCQSIKELNKWIVDGRYLLEVDKNV